MESYQPDALPLIDLAVLLSPLTTTINKNNLRLTKLIL